MQLVVLAGSGGTEFSGHKHNVKCEANTIRGWNVFWV